MNKLIEKRYTVILLLMAILSIPFMGRGLYESSEGRYARVAQTMVRSHDYWMPKLNGEPHLTKPPLTYWVIATGIDIGGENTYGARLFHTIIWILTAWIVISIGTTLGSETLGFYSSLIFATSLFPAIGSWSLTTDPLLVFFQAFYFLALLRYEKEESLISAAIFWVMIGLSLLTKGPVALLPLLFLIPTWKKTLWELVKTQLWIIGLLIGASWYILLEINYPGTITRLIRDELILRTTTDVSGRNPFWWAPLAVYFLPFLIGWGLWPLLIHKEKVSETWKSPTFTWQKSMVVWVLGSLIFFSLVKSRLTLYILPLSIPMSVLLADFLKQHEKVLKVALVNGVLILVMKSYGTFFHHSPDDSYQITNFAKSFVGNKPVILLWEKSLFGLEYYLPTQFKKNINPIGSLDLSEKTNWMLFQTKRTKNFENLINLKGLHVKQTHTFFKWKLCEVTTNES